MQYQTATGISTLLNEPRHENPLFVQYANNKGADQPAVLHSPISTYVVCCLDSILFLVSIPEIL